MLATLVTHPAFGCLFVEEWQAKPQAATVHQSTEIYLAKLQDYKEISELHVHLRLRALRVLKGADVKSFSLIVEKTGESEKESSETTYHSDTAFWSGGVANGGLRADCQYAPRHLRRGQTYLVLLTDGRIVSAVGFEPIATSAKDDWLEFVEQQLLDK